MGRLPRWCDLRGSELSHTKLAFDEPSGWVECLVRGILADVGASRCFRCSFRKLSASDTSFSAEILGCHHFGRRWNSENCRCSIAVFRCSCAKVDHRKWHWRLELPAWREMSHGMRPINVGRRQPVIEGLSHISFAQRPLHGLMPSALVLPRDLPVVSTCLDGLGSHCSRRSEL